MSPLATVDQLATLLRVTIDDNDPYARMMLAHASSAVRDFTGHQNWVIDPDAAPPLVTAPGTASEIALWVASRAYTNPKNLERRASGPISETFRDSGVYGIGLTATEKDRLTEGGFVVHPTRNGLWVQPLYTGREITMITVPSDMTPPGDPFYIADAGQFPYV